MAYRRVELLEPPGRHPLLRGTPCLREPSRPGLVINARRLEFASPLALAAVAALTHTRAAGSVEIALLLPERRGVASYLQRMDLLKQLLTMTPQRPGTSDYREHTFTTYQRTRARVEGTWA
ncbi:hypothetical protein [Streptomyces yangpuensis]